MDRSSAVLTWTSDNNDTTTTAWQTFKIRPLYPLEHIVRDILKKKFVNFGMFTVFSMGGASTSREEFLREIKNNNGTFSCGDDDGSEWYSCDEFTSASYVTYVPDSELLTKPKCFMACGPKITLVINYMDPANKYIELVRSGQHDYYKFK